MKKLKMLSALFLVSMLLSSVVLADEAVIQDLPGGGWWSGESIQNIGPEEATVIGVAYDLEATTASPEGDYSTPSFTIPEGGAVTILPESLAAAGDPVFEGMDGHRGSAMFSSDQPLVATVNMTNREVAGLVGVQGGYAAGIYEGTDGQDTGTQLNFPIAKNNYVNKDTTYFVQNAGSEAAVITAQFLWSGGTANWTSGDPVAPGYGVVIPSDLMAAGALGSAVVTADVPLAGVHTEHESNESGVSPSRVLKTTKAFVPADGDDVVIAPSYKKGFGAAGKERSSSLNIQAQQDGVSGQIVYTCALGACTAGATFTVNFGPIDAGEAYVGWPYNADHSSLPEGSLFAARVTASGGALIVATVDETGFNAGGFTTSPNRDSTYSAIPESMAATRWSCPVVKERYFDNSGAPTVFATGADVTVDVQYTVAGSESGALVGSTYTIDNYAIDGGASGTFFDVAYGGVTGLTWVGGNALPSSTGINASVIIEATGGSIVVTTNENVHYLRSLLQDAKQYSCFPLE